MFFPLTQTKPPDTDIFGMFRVHISQIFAPQLYKIDKNGAFFQFV